MKPEPPKVTDPDPIPMGPGSLWPIVGLAVILMILMLAVAHVI